MNLLVCGGAGFIGSNFARLIREQRPEWRIVIYDALTYAGRRSTLADLKDVPLVHARIEDEDSLDTAIRAHAISHIVNFAAESHNDRSILDATAFLATNVTGTYVLLEAVKRHQLQKLVHVSTDEVYGSIASGEFTEDSPIEPNTPYSASKAGGDLMCRAHFTSFQTPVCITRGGNTYGPFQYPEKLISFFTVRLLQDKKVPLYGEGQQIREWIHVRDHCRGILAVLEQGVPGMAYNIGDVNERRNIETVQMLLAETGRPESLIKRIPDPRKGAHDARYSMACGRLHAMGWKPQVDFAQGIRETVAWYREHEGWWREVVAEPDYQAFVARFYGPGLGEDL